MVPELNPSKRKELLAEANFYQITRLINELESQNKDSTRTWFNRGGRSKYATKRRHRHNK
jgi:hypothetical protein